MNKITVSDDRYRNSAYKVYSFSPGAYNIGDIVEVQEVGSSRLAVIVERTNELCYGNGCDTCVFRNPESFQAVPCGYTTHDGWFPCVALATRGTSVLFRSVDTIMEDL